MIGKAVRRALDLPVFRGFPPLSLRDVQVCRGINSVLAACAREASLVNRFLVFERGNFRR
jgi:hypothetical protein